MVNYVSALKIKAYIWIEKSSFTDNKENNNNLQSLYHNFFCTSKKKKSCLFKLHNCTKSLRPFTVKKNLIQHSCKTTLLLLPYCWQRFFLNMIPQFKSLLLLSFFSIQKRLGRIFLANYKFSVLDICFSTSILLFQSIVFLQYFYSFFVFPVNLQPVPLILCNIC